MNQNQNQNQNPNISITEIPMPNWYAVYTIRHELIGTLNLKYPSELEKYKSITLHGVDKTVALSPSRTENEPSNGNVTYRVKIRLQEIRRDGKALFYYVIAEDHALPKPPQYQPSWLLDKTLTWIDGTFAPLGPSMCDYCPERKR